MRDRNHVHVMNVHMFGGTGSAGLFFCEGLAYANMARDRCTVCKSSVFATLVREEWISAQELKGNISITTMH